MSDFEVRRALKRHNRVHALVMARRRHVDALRSAGLVELAEEAADVLRRWEDVLEVCRQEVELQRSKNRPRGVP